MWKTQKNGSTYLQERVKDKNGKPHIVSVKVTTTQKAAREVLERKISELNDSHYTLSKVEALYLKEQSKVLKKSSLDNRIGILKCVKDVCGDFDINKVTAGQIREMMIDSGKAPQTLNMYISILKTLLKWSYQNDYLQDYDLVGKMHGFKVPSEREKVKDKYLEPYELKKLIDGMEIKRYSLLTEFLALSGLRIGEAIALDDSDVGDMYIKVYKTVYAKDKTVGSAKTADSNREVFIQPELRDCIKRIRECMKLQPDCFGYTPNEYFFSDRNGKRINYYAYRNYLYTHAETLLGRRITPHTLRHTMTSLFAAQGVSLDAISRRLGHSNDKITREIYLHITEQMKANENAEISKVDFGLATGLAKRLAKKVKKDAINS